MTPAGRGKSRSAGLAVLLAVLTLEAARVLCGTPLSTIAFAEKFLFVAVALAAAGVCRPSLEPDGRWNLSAGALSVIATGVVGALAGAFLQSDVAAGIALAAFWAVTLGAASVPAPPRRGARRGVLVLTLAASAGMVPMAAVEVESRFAHEEIFVALGALPLSIAWMWLWFALRPRRPPQPAASRRGVRLRPGALGLVACLLALASVAAAVASYQASFSSPDPPPFPGISPQSPFLCGESRRADPDTFPGSEVFAALLARVGAARPPTPPEEGMLALATGDRKHASAFRSGLLDEVSRGEFSRIGETKFWQYEASFRAYYYPRVRAAFPGLFAPEDDRRVLAWFAAVNRRALAWGFVDAIYATAFAKLPEGPYENQENGAGLLALLEAGGLAAPELSKENRRYLDRTRRGWAARFRNNDDSYGYQPEWINNALFQSLRTGKAPEDAVRRSFEWLLLQAEPGGVAPDYNAGVPSILPGTAYLGATLLRDPSLLWLSGKSLKRFEGSGLPLPAQPGVERPIALEGRSPSAGSCLLYADSGLPNRVGPLAPDKIVFRDGWTDDSAYALLNLRFAGWHRYRATNAVVLLRHGETIVEEKRGGPFSWLPLERRIFRDKRIPREYTNALLVEPTGYAAAVSRLTGFGGRWAQDPPHFARIEDFETNADADRSTTSLSNWRGWSQRRTIDFHHGGPIVVFDRADGPATRASALAWHVSGPGRDRGHFRFVVADGAEFLLLPLEESGGSVETSRIEGSEGLDVLYRPARRGRLRLATVFLIGEWSGARVQIGSSAGKRTVDISSDAKRLSIPLP